MAPQAPPDVLPDAWEAWLQTFRYPPEVIYHYTTADALISILTYKRMWATNLLFTNDPADLGHGERIADEAITRGLTKCDGLATEWLDGFRQTTRAQIERNDFYSVSFCTNGDLLSQWRAYGAVGGGFAMGWNCVSAFPGDPLRVGITYDEALQAATADSIVQAHVAYAGDIKNVRAPEVFERLKKATGSLGVFFSMFLYSFKHPAFAAEDEFRWVYPAYEHELPEGVVPQFRRFGSIVKPYIEVDFSRAELVDIVFGPTVDPALTSRWLRLALDTNGYRDTKIRASVVPMRAL